MIPDEMRYKLMRISSGIMIWSFNPMWRWYLVHTKPAGEVVAQMHLERQGYEVYLPRLVQSQRRGGRWRERVVPLFPRYLFLRLNAGRQALGPVRSTVGVTNVVRFGSDYAVVPDEVIRGLQARADSETGLHRLNLGCMPEPGMRVRIASGPLDGLEGVFERKAGAERVVVLLRLLGQDARVEVYLPRLVQSQRRGGRWRERVVPLFPRYLFLRLNAGRQALGPVRSTVGVTNVVRFGSDYAVVPDEVIRGLQARADSETGLHRLNLGCMPEPGMRVRIASGPLDGLEGVFERKAGAERVVVLLRLLGQDARVRVSVDSIVPVFAA